MQTGFCAINALMAAHMRFTLANHAEPISRMQGCALVSAGASLARALANHARVLSTRGLRDLQVMKFEKNPENVNSIIEK